MMGVLRFFLIILAALVVMSCGLSPQPPTAEKDFVVPGCDPVNVDGLSLASYQPQTREAKIYRNLVQEMLATLRKEQSLLRISSASTPQSPGELSRLVDRSRLSDTQKDEQEKLRLAFNDKVKEIVRYPGLELSFVDLVRTILVDMAMDAHRVSTESVKLQVAREVETLAALFSKEPTAASRAMTSTVMDTWPEGKIHYKFSTENRSGHNDKHLERLREVVRWAAKVWTEQTAGAVQFIEVSHNSTSDFSSAVAAFLYGPRHLLKINFENPGDNNNNGVLGRAHVGYTQDSTLWLNPAILSDGTIENKIKDLSGDQKLAQASVQDFARFVALHELGHVLGLKHEHESLDRDHYLADPYGSMDHQNGPTPFLDGWKQRREGAFLVPLPYQRYCPQATEQLRTRYDYFSVMGYPMGQTTTGQTSTLEVKGSDGRYRKVTLSVAPGTELQKLRPALEEVREGKLVGVGQRAFLSPFDIAMIKYMYAGVL